MYTFNSLPGDSAFGSESQLDKMFFHLKIGQPSLQKAIKKCIDNSDWV